MAGSTPLNDSRTLRLKVSKRRSKRSRNSKCSVTGVLSLSATNLVSSKAIPSSRIFLSLSGLKRPKNAPKRPGKSQGLKLCLKAQNGQPTTTGNQNRRSNRKSRNRNPVKRIPAHLEKQTFPQVAPEVKKPESGYPDR